MSEKSKIYLSNWASHKTAGHHGPGRLFSIMVKTPYWAKAAGVVDVLVPYSKALWDLRSEQLDMEGYQRLYLEKVKPQIELLEPGKLVARVSGTGEVLEVVDGDTLCCSCSRSAASSGRCHRSWAAQLLLDAGWKVVLDGVLLLG